MTNSITSTAIIYAMAIGAALPADPAKYCGSITTLKVMEAMNAKSAI